MSRTLAAVGVIVGLGAIAVAARIAADAAERKARAVLAATCVCATCRQTPVLTPGAECAGCQYAAGQVRHVCPVCGAWLVPQADALCAACLSALDVELDKWAAS